MELRAATNRDDMIRTGYDETLMLGHTYAWSLENKTLSSWWLWNVFAVM